MNEARKVKLEGMKEQYMALWQSIRSKVHWDECDGKTPASEVRGWTDDEELIEALEKGLSRSPAGRVIVNLADVSREFKQAMWSLLNVDDDDFDRQGNIHMRKYVQVKLGL